MPGYRIAAPFLSTEESQQAITGFGGPEPSRNATGLLAALQGKPMYGGADHDVVAERRRKNKAARKARRTTRRAAKR